jgi:lysophospholipase L1-like esterase
VAIACLALVGLAGCSKSSSPTASSSSASTRDFGANNPSKYVAFGDSLTQGTNGVRPYPVVLEQRLRGIDRAAVVVNRGVGGEETGGGRGRIGGVLAADRPGFLLILEGTNSLGDMPLVSDIREMIRRAKANETVPLVGAIPPQFGDLAFKNSLIRTTNSRIQGAAAQEGVPFVDLYTVLDDPKFFIDDFHPNDLGHAAMADAWFQAILTIR